MRTLLNKRLARKLVNALYTTDIKKIISANFGTRNKVFFIHTKGRESDVVLRINENHSNITNFFKEQWCIETAQKIGIPVPQVLEVGNHIIPFPYFFAKFKKGISGNEYLDKKKLYLNMGKTLSQIHTIKTHDYGVNFDWSSNSLSKIKTWKNYLDTEYNFDDANKKFSDNDVIDQKNIDRMAKVYKEMLKWEFEPVLCHNDFIDKNILVNKDGKITAVLDWELAISSHPFRDLGKTWRGILHFSDKTMVKYFFQGYGMSEEEYLKNRDYMYIFDFIKDAGTVVEHKTNGNIKEISNIKKFWNDYFENIFN